MNYVDKMFIKNCKEIIKDGISTVGGEVRPKWLDTQEPAHTVGLFGVMNKYDLSKGLPLLTIRKINWKKAIEEILWIWQLKSNNTNDLNSKIWDSWADEDGSIGKAYGYQLAQEFNWKGKKIDQVDFIIEAVKKHSLDRGLITNLYNHQDLEEMHLRPCAHSCQFAVRGDKLDLMLVQRSQDTLVANNWNVVQYSALTKMFAQIGGLKPGTLVHVIGDMHIYDRHIPIVEKLLEEYISYPLPKTTLNPNVKDFYDFKVSDFQVSNYITHTDIKGIPVAV